MTASAIEWTDRSDWNPIRGCSRVSSGCASCYAERIASRFSGPGAAFEGFAKDGRWTGRVELQPDRLLLPLSWRKPARVFVNSASDLFHEKLSDEEIAAVFGVMAAAPRHTFQVLTRRPERAAKWFEWRLGQRAPKVNVRSLVHGAAGMADALGLNGDRIVEDAEAYLLGGEWPLPNVWLGVSVEDQTTADERIPHLLACPAAVRWISAEPLIGPVKLPQFLGIKPSECEDVGVGLDWVVCGGESGPGARPFDLSWARAIVRQCREADVAAFVKQVGSLAVDGLREDAIGAHPTADDAPSTARAWERGDFGPRFRTKSPKGGDPSEWPADLRVQAFPDVGASPNGGAT